MKSIPVSCCDERVALARRGTLSASEWQDFATHLTVCIDCRIAWRLASDFDRSASARPGDERMIARGVKLALAPVARSQGALVRIAIAASVTLVAAGVASGAMVLHARYAGPAGWPAEIGKTAPPRPRGVGVPRAMPATTADQATPVGPSIAEGLEAEGSEALAAKPASPAGEASRVTRAVAKPVVRAPQQVASVDQSSATASPLLSPPSQRDDAAGLFAQAVAERQQGRAEMAIAAFRALQRRYPKSHEATVALVSLGYLLFVAGNRAEALLVFESYLLRAPTGTLVPEALIGKARALEALGRSTEAASTWRAVARQFPDSPYARRAQGAGTGGTLP